MQGMHGEGCRCRRWCECEVHAQVSLQVQAQTLVCESEAHVQVSLHVRVWLPSVSSMFTPLECAYHR